MQQTLPNNSCWVGYILAAKNVLDALQDLNPATGSDTSIILGWMYYFDVMARFSLRHWRTKQIEAIARGLGFHAQGEDLCVMQHLLARESFAKALPNISAHVHPIIQLLGEVSDVALYSSDPNYHSAEYQAQLDDLRWRLPAGSPLTHEPPLLADASIELNDRQPIELTRLAGMIYLERVSRNFSGRSDQLTTWNIQALSIVAKCDSYLCSFALFVIGCEARTDEQRIVILKYYARMEARPQLRSFTMTKSLIETAWNQQDLAEDEQVGYVRKINLALSSRDILPPLV
jgi:hypothetical protein